MKISERGYALAMSQEKLWRGKSDAEMLEAAMRLTEEREIKRWFRAQNKADDIALAKRDAQ